MGLSMVFLQLKGPLELFVKRRKFLPGPGSGFLLRCVITQAAESNINPFLPFYGPATSIARLPGHVDLEKTRMPAYIPLVEY